MLAHRLGLVPLAVDPRLFQYKVCGRELRLGSTRTSHPLPQRMCNMQAQEEAASEANTLVFRLKVQCRRAPDGALVNDKVYSSALEWLPQVCGAVATACMLDQQLSAVRLRYNCPCAVLRGARFRTRRPRVLLPAKHLCCQTAYALSTATSCWPSCDRGSPSSWRRMQSRVRKNAALALARVVVVTAAYQSATCPAVLRCRGG